MGWHLKFAMEACLGPRSEAEDGEDSGHNGTKPEEWSRALLSACSHERGGEGEARGQQRGGMWRKTLRAATRVPWEAAMDILECTCTLLLCSLRFGRANGKRAERLESAALR